MVNDYYNFLTKTTVYRHQDWYKQGKSCVVVPLPDHKKVAKLYYTEEEAKLALYNQTFFSLFQLAPIALSTLYYIELKNQQTGGLSGQFWYFVSEKAELQPVMTERLKKIFEKRLQEIDPGVEYEVNRENTGILKGKYVLLDTLEIN